MIGTDLSIIDPIASDKVQHGLVFGKFMPPTMGHMYLVDVARQSSQKLTIVVGTLPDEPIPGQLRYQWMKEMFPDCHVVHLDIPMPQEPSHPQDIPFFQLWADKLYEYSSHARFDALFASEPYGYKVADAMKIKFIPVDTTRQSVRISATEIRRDPIFHWDKLPVPVRPYFVQRVCLVGGDIALRRDMAHHLASCFNTVYADDIGSVMLADFRKNLPDYPSALRDIDMPTVLRAQRASEAALLRQARGLLFTVGQQNGDQNDIVFDLSSGANSETIIAELTARFPSLVKA